MMNIQHNMMMLLKYGSVTYPEDNTLAERSQVLFALQILKIPYDIKYRPGCERPFEIVLKTSDVPAIEDMEQVPQEIKVEFEDQPIIEDVALAPAEIEVSFPIEQPIDLLATAQNLFVQSLVQEDEKKLRELAESLVDKGNGLYQNTKNLHRYNKIGNAFPMMNGDHDVQSSITAVHHETQEPMTFFVTEEGIVTMCNEVFVIYQNVDTGEYWAREYDSFYGHRFTGEGIPVRRFIKIVE
jgi:hypothetical protein